MSAPAPRRDAALDVLRAVAVLLVVATHLPAAAPAESGAILHAVTLVLRRGGWVGVDLFFALSGYLVSGLLFREATTAGRIDGWRFFIRRAFKIYPSYYVLLLVTGVAIATGKYLIAPQRLLSSALFLSNYTGAAWDHLWSLSVEEHFYLLLSVGLPLWLRGSRAERAPFAAMPVVVAVVGVACLTGRIITARAHPNEWWLVREPTHLRLDALAVGVWLAWVRHYVPELWRRLSSHAFALMLVGVVGLLPPFLFEYADIRGYYPFGFTVSGVASACLIAGALSRPVGDGWFVRGLAYLGQRSYGLYLVHLPVVTVTARLFSISDDWFGFLAFYLAASLACAVALTGLVEAPALRLRDRLFP